MEFSSSVMWAALVDTFVGTLGNKIFKAKFVKSDGSVREMRCRKGVKKYAKGKGLRYDPASRGNLIVYDLDKRAYRTIPLRRVLELKCGIAVIRREGCVTMQTL